jgi:hypothetical protein
MDELTMAYLLGPAVMLVLAAGLWLIAHRRIDNDLKSRPGRWLDTHPVNWLRHRH